MKLLGPFVAIFIFFSGSVLKAQEPTVLSVFPLGGQRGTRFTAEIRGYDLDGASAVWFDCDALKAKVVSVEEIRVTRDEEKKEKTNEKGEEKKKPQRALVMLTIDRKSEVGAHVLRLISPAGVSGPLTFQVNAEPAVLETTTPHNTPDRAQELSFPVVLNGKIGEKSEVDHYRITAHEDEHLLFEVRTASGLLLTAPQVFRAPQLALYEPSGSWFNPQRPRPLECDDESLFWVFPKGPFYYSSHYLPRLSRRFERTGRYLIEVRGFEGYGGPDHTYQLRMVAVRGSTVPGKFWTPRVLAHSSDPDWLDRDFERKLAPERLRTLWSRSVHVPPQVEKGEPRNNSAASRVEAEPNPIENDRSGDPAYSRALLTSIGEKEPNVSADNAVEITIPGIVEGAIGHPGDVDVFKFRVKNGESLAFEIETPDVSYPYFSPRLSVSNRDGQEVLTNIYRKVAGDGDDWLKSLEPKTIYTFEQEGDFDLNIRDLSPRNGNPRLRYRILIRPRIPHIGRVVPKTFGIVGTETQEDRINLAPGDTRKLAVISEQEEGFDGEIGLHFENLPRGVQVLPATAYHREINSQPGQVFEARGALHIERFRPRRLVTMLIFRADARAPATPMPHIIRLIATPILQGKGGQSIPVYEMPLMMIRPARQKAQ